VKPLLGFNKDYSLSALTYPVYASPKLDGIRCLARNGGALSRKLLDIPNGFVQQRFFENANLFEGLDGELIVGHLNAPDVYRKTMSGVMSRDGEPDFVYCVFDYWDRPDQTFEARYEVLKRGGFPDWVMILPQTLLNSPEEVSEFEAECIKLGYEGICLRYPNSKYKFGRSTLKEGALLKRKSWEDYDVRITAIHEAIRNDNEAKVDELGNTKRSHSKEGRTEGKGYVGSMEGIVIGGEHDGKPAGIGTFRGLDTEQKRVIFADRDQYIGKIAKVKAMNYGMKDALRHGVFLDWRHEDD
jgi:DNA ligase-1